MIADVFENSQNSLWVSAHQITCNGSFMVLESSQKDTWLSSMMPELYGIIEALEQPVWCVTNCREDRRV
jgi:hypothetical protein